MLKAKLYDISLLLVSIVVAFYSGKIIVDTDIFIKALVIYLIFSCLYFHLRIISKKSSTISIDYGISYSLSFGILAGPLGLFFFEIIYRFIIYFYRKRTKTADPDEFIDTLYNIGSFTLSNSIAYYLFVQLYPYFKVLPFGFWILICALYLVHVLFSGTFLAISLTLLGNINSLREAIRFIMDRNLLDMGKAALTNGLLLLLLQEEKWDMIISIFFLNYLVSRSFQHKSQSIQDKIERDKFEQMAYTDFLTDIPNRAFMDKIMADLNKSGENIGIIVADIDNFKRINDSYNHAIGDRVIQHFAKMLKDNLNEDDYLFRSGGEEFTFFLRNRDFSSCAKLVEKIRLEVENSLVEVEYLSEKISISYTVSFGLYYYNVNTDISIEKGYIQADQLLLQSKQLGRNRITVKNDLINETQAI